MIEEKEKRKVKFSVDFEKIEDLVEKLTEKMIEKKKSEEKTPSVMGFSLSFDSSNSAFFEEFSDGEEGKEIQLKEKPETFLAETMETKKEIILTLQVPSSIKKEELKIKTEENRVKILSSSKENSFFKEIFLGKNIKEKNFSLKNGVLEITLQKELAKNS